MLTDSVTECWIEPDTGLRYPTAYRDYRRAREAQERFPPRHCRLGREVDRHVSRRWRVDDDADGDVQVSVRAGVSPRVQRLVGDVLRSIRRGQSADDAIRHAARRFRLRCADVRAFISAAVVFEIHARAAESASATSSLAGWL